jgi:sugar (pentulose or hexulose) kinase
MSKPEGGGLDTDLRPVAAAPPLDDGIARTMPGSTFPNGMPERHPYLYLDGENVAEPAEIVRALHRQLGLRYYDCCGHCEHDSGDPPHTVRCDGGCNDSQDGETP